MDIYIYIYIYPYIYIYIYMYIYVYIYNIYICIHIYIYIYIYQEPTATTEPRGEQEERVGQRGCVQKCKYCQLYWYKSTNIERAAARREQSLQHLQHGEKEERAPDGAPRVSMSLSTALLHILARSSI